MFPYTNPLASDRQRLGTKLQQDALSNCYVFGNFSASFHTRILPSSCITAVHVYYLFDTLCSANVFYRFYTVLTVISTFIFLLFLCTSCIINLAWVFSVFPLLFSRVPLYY